MYIRGPKDYMNGRIPHSGSKAHPETMVFRILMLPFGPLGILAIERVSLFFFKDARELCYLREWLEASYQQRLFSGCSVPRAVVLLIILF